jgi:hypothetical protein
MNVTLRGAAPFVGAVLVVGGFLGVLGFVKGWTAEDWARKHVPRCPDAGLYSWSVDADDQNTDLVAATERFLIERNWTHVNHQHLPGHYTYIGDLKVPELTITGRCIPGTYDPATGRIMAPGGN